MSDEDKGIFDRLRARGEEVFGQLTNELMQNEHFMKAMQGALQGKERVDRAVGKAMKTMNVPTRSEVKRAVSRIEALEEEVKALKAKLKTASRSRTSASKASARKR